MITHDKEQVISRSWLLYEKKFIKKSNKQKLKQNLISDKIRELVEKHSNIIVNNLSEKVNDFVTNAKTDIEDLNISTFNFSYDYKIGDKKCCITIYVTRDLVTKHIKILPQNLYFLVYHDTEYIKFLEEVDNIVNEKIKHKSISKVSFIIKCMELYKEYEPEFKQDFVDVIKQNFDL